MRISVSTPSPSARPSPSATPISVKDTIPRVRAVKVVAGAGLLLLALIGFIVQVALAEANVGPLVFIALLGGLGFYLCWSGVRLRRRREDTTTEELLQFLTAFGRNLTRLIAGLDAGERSMVNLALQAMTAQDLGAKLTAVFSLTEPSSLERLADPLKAIEADLTHAGAFVGKPGFPPALNIFGPSELMVVKSVLAAPSSGSPRAAQDAPGPALSQEPPAPAWPREEMTVGILTADEFDELAKGSYRALKQWELCSIMCVSGGSQSEMIQRLREYIDRLAADAPDITPDMIERVRRLDDRLALGGRAVTLCGEVVQHVASFRSKVNGAAWQELLRKVKEMTELLEQLRIKHVGQSFDQTFTLRYP